MELTKLYLERLRRYDPLLKCVVTFMDELALKQAERADQELRAKNDRGPLHGIPLGRQGHLLLSGLPHDMGRLAISRPRHRREGGRRRTA